MRLTEFETEINKRAHELQLDTQEKQTYFEDVATKVEQVVRAILKEVFSERDFLAIYVSVYKGNVVIKSSSKDNSIIVKVKRFNGTTEWKYSSSIKYYYLNKVEVTTASEQTSLQDWYAECQAYEKAKQDEQDAMINDFIRFVKEKDITLDDFQKYAEVYKRNPYKIQKLLNK